MTKRTHDKVQLIIRQYYVWCETTVVQERDSVSFKVKLDDLFERRLQQGKLELVSALHHFDNFHSN